jgi:hypothetical protein
MATSSADSKAMRENVIMEGEKWEAEHAADTVSPGAMAEFFVRKFVTDLHSIS